MSDNITAGLPAVLDETNPSASFGMTYTAPDGRRYRYARAGAVALVVGNLLQSSAQDTGDQNIAATAAAVGATSITTAAMTVTANQYAGGYVTVTVTPGLGSTYRIKSHAAYTAAAATFELEEPIQVALTATSTLDFVANPYNLVVVFPITPTGVPVGVAVNDLAINGYGWIQVAGPCNIKNDAAGALTVGVQVMPSTSVAGNIRLGTAGLPVIGNAITGIAASENGLVFLNIS